MSQGADPRETMSVRGWLNHGFITLVILSTQRATAVDNLEVVFQWKALEYAWPDAETELLFSHYVRENNNPMGLEVAGDRLFITVPRWTAGVAATLNYIYLNDTSETPLLNPYPSWEAHRFDEENTPEVVSTFRVWADSCDRLWVLDMGVDDQRGSRTQVVSPALLIYDLKEDVLLRKYVLPTAQVPTVSHFANVVVEDSTCENAFAYLAEIRNSGLIVYSWATNNSWLVNHHYFYPDPLAGHFNASGLFFQWWDGVINLALAPQEDGYSTLYFHPLCSNAEFSVSTRILQDPELSTSTASFHEYVYLGSRDSNGQGAASYLDPKSGILFHTLLIANAISCWNPASISYNVENVARVYADNTTLVSPSDIKIDGSGNIWVMSNRLPVFMYGELDFDDYNFRVLKGSVEGAVAGTVCSYGIRTYHTGGLFSMLVILLLVYENGQEILETIL